MRHTVFADMEIGFRFIFDLKFEHFATSSYKALLLKEINIV